MTQLQRTMFAQAAIDFSAYFEMNFARTVVAGACERKPKLIAPEGMSTGGGKQAMQHIVLEPTTEGFKAVTVGWVDKANQAAQLRSYVYLESLHRQRYGKRPFDLNEQSYRQFFEHAQRFLANEKMVVSVENELPMAVASPASPATQSSNKPLILIAVVLFVLLIVLVAVVAGAYFFL